MKKLLLLLPFMLLMGCKKEIPDQGSHGMGGSYVPAVTYFKLKNSAGQDLLNPLTPNAIDYRGIEIYDLSSSGQKVYDKYRGFEIKKDSSNEYYISLSYTGGIKIGNRMTRYIRYADGSEDKITIEFRSSPGNDGMVIAVDILWINDILRATNTGSNNLGVLEIIK